MIQIYIGTKSVDESNKFFRKLWGLIAQILGQDSVGWCYTPYTIKKDNIVHLGNSSLGEIFFDYKIKGCINNLFINCSEENEESVRAAVKEAIAFDKGLLNKRVRIYFKNKVGYLFASNCYEGIVIKDEYIEFNIEVYSILDLKHAITQVQYMIECLLSEYTLTLFSTLKVEVGEGCKIKEDWMEYSYDYDWIDYDQIPIKDDSNTNSKIILPMEFFILLKSILTYKKTKKINLLLDASVAYHCAVVLHEEYSHNSEFSELIDTQVITSLETLAVLNSQNIPVIRCEECGNLKYSVVQKLKDLILKYEEAFIYKNLIEPAYRRRSRLVHEGIPRTKEIYSGAVFPLINEDEPSTMNNAMKYNDKFLLEFGGMLFRKVASEHLINNTPE